MSVGILIENTLNCHSSANKQIYYKFLPIPQSLQCRVGFNLLLSSGSAKTLLSGAYWMPPLPFFLSALRKKITLGTHSLLTESWSCPNTHPHSHEGARKQ